MKKINTLKIRDFREMNAREMSKVIGGYNGSLICVANKDWTNYSSISSQCFTTREEAEAHAGDNGFWCCNCAEAYSRCL